MWFENWVYSLFPAMFSSISVSQNHKMFKEKKKKNPAHFKPVIFSLENKLRPTRLAKPEELATKGQVPGCLCSTGCLLLPAET